MLGPIYKIEQSRTSIFLCYYQSFIYLFIFLGGAGAGRLGIRLRPFPTLRFS